MKIHYMMTVIDTHVTGEAVRVIPQVPIIFNGGTLEENNHIAHTTFNKDKELLLGEPRGHRGMKGCIVLPSKVADFALLFLEHSSKKNPISYSGLIGATTALLETGHIKGEREIYTIETIEGIYQVKIKNNAHAGRVFTLEIDQWQVTNHNPMFTKVKSKENRHYYIYSLPKEIQAIQMKNVMELQQWGKRKMLELTKENDEIAGVILYEKDERMPQRFRAVTFEKDGYILRSPGIETTLAILTKLANEQQIKKGITVESIFNCSFQAFINNEQLVIEGKTGFIGTRQLMYDQADPFPNGFLIE